MCKRITRKAFQIHTFALKCTCGARTRKFDPHSTGPYTAYKMGRRKATPSFTDPKRNGRPRWRPGKKTPSFTDSKRCGMSYFKVQKFENLKIRNFKNWELGNSETWDLEIKFKTWKLETGDRLSQSRNFRISDFRISKLLRNSHISNFAIPPI